MWSVGRFVKAWERLVGTLPRPCITKWLSVYEGRRNSPFPFGVYLSYHLYLLDKELEDFCASFYNNFGVFLRNKSVVKIWLMKGKFNWKKNSFCNFDSHSNRILKLITVSHTGFHNQNPKLRLLFSPYSFSLVLLGLCF